MEKREENESELCALCGEPVDVTDSVTYVASPGTVVCGACARKHGGVYHPERERWEVRPRLPARFERPDGED